MKDSIQRNARVAGLLYLVVVILGPFVLLYVPGRIFVPGNATATMTNILEHESLFRAGIAAALVSEVFFILSVLALHRLLEGVDRALAAVMVVLILIQVPLGLAGTATQVALLSLARGGETLAVFDGPQRDALMHLLLVVDGAGILVNQVYWGLWLLPLGMLVIRSGFLPRFLGVWLFANGLAYVATSATGLFLPQHVNAVRTITMPLLFGEMALMVCLIVVGVRSRSSAPPAAVANAAVPRSPVQGD